MNPHVLHEHTCVQHDSGHHKVCEDHQSTSRASAQVLHSAGGYREQPAPRPLPAVHLLDWTSLLTYSMLKPQDLLDQCLVVGFSHQPGKEVLGPAGSNVPGQTCQARRCHGPRAGRTGSRTGHCCCQHWQAPQASVSTTHPRACFWLHAWHLRRSVQVQ